MNRKGRSATLESGPQGEIEIGSDKGAIAPLKGDDAVIPVRPRSDPKPGCLGCFRGWREWLARLPFCTVRVTSSHS
ncbi:Uncharacterised protein [Mycobacteroides abscessus]|nr:Uncharacterised protein [Mycobacteroides abscessus]